MEVNGNVYHKPNRWKKKSNRWRKGARINYKPNRWVEVPKWLDARKYHFTTLKGGNNGK